MLVHLMLYHRGLSPVLIFKHFLLLLNLISITLSSSSLSHSSVSSNLLLIPFFFTFSILQLCCFFFNILTVHSFFSQVLLASLQSLLRTIHWIGCLSSHNSSGVLSYSFFPQLPHFAIFISMYLVSLLLYFPTSEKWNFVGDILLCPNSLLPSVY